MHTRHAAGRGHDFPTYMFAPQVHNSVFDPHMSPIRRWARRWRNPWCTVPQNWSLRPYTPLCMRDLYQYIQENHWRPGLDSSYCITTEMLLVTWRSGGSLFYFIFYDRTLTHEESVYTLQSSTQVKFRKFWFSMFLEWLSHTHTGAMGRERKEEANVKKRKKKRKREKNATGSPRKREGEKEEESLQLNVECTDSESIFVFSPPFSIASR